MGKPKTKSIKGYGLKSTVGFSPAKGDVNTTKPPASGDSYGTGFKNPTGRVRSMSGINPVSKKALKKPPKSLA